MYMLYNLLLWAAAPLVGAWAALRAARGRLPGLAQRLGFLPGHADSRARSGGSPAPGPCLWLHAVSLGEVKVAGMLARELKERVSGLRCVITTSTRTGYEQARRQAAAADAVLYPPADYRWICRRFLRRIRPDAVLVLETELWPNLFREVKRLGLPLWIVNGRISDRSLPRYLRSRWLWPRVLAFPDRILAQSEEDARRFVQLGADRGRVRAAGSLKYGIRPRPSPLVQQLRAAIARAEAGPVLVAGSTMPGEEQVLLNCYQQLTDDYPRLILILAPRHPERFSAVAELVRSERIPVQLRSLLPSSKFELRAPGVLLLDSTGELDALYELATVAFVGGTLVPTGGHNVLEPACFAKPTIIGPSMQNFAEIATEFLRGAAPLPVGEGEKIRAAALVQVQDSEGLAAALRYLFTEPDAAAQIGAAARRLFEQHSRGMDELLNEVEQLLRPHGAAEIPESAAHPLPAALKVEKLRQ